MSQTNYNLYVDWNNDGDFGDSNENITSYVMQLEWQRGRDLANNLRGESISGTLKVVLLNTSGIFSSFNTSSALYGNLLPSRKIKLQMGAGSFPYAFPLKFNQDQWVGYLESVVPFPQISGRDTAVLSAVGPLGFLNRRTIKVSPQADRRTDQAIGDILDAAGWAASDRDLDEGNTTIKRFSIPPNTRTIDALRMVENTENGFISETKDGKIKYENRQARFKDTNAITSQATLSDATSTSNFSFNTIEQEDSLANIFNEVTIGLKKHTTQAGADIVWIHPEVGSDSPAIPPGQTRIYRAVFPQEKADTTQMLFTSADSIGAWTTTAATTDVLANLSSDGTGTNVTSDLTISNTKTANAMDISLTNDNDSTVYITKLQARATIVTQSDTSTITVKDATSENTFGKRSFESNAPFIPSSEEAFRWCQFNLVRFKDPIQTLKVQIPANRNDTTLEKIQSLDISDRITLDIHTKTGLIAADKDFFIEAISNFVINKAQHQTQLVLSPVSSISRFWVLGVSLLESETFITY